MTRALLQTAYALLSFTALVPVSGAGPTAAPLLGDCLEFTVKSTQSVNDAWPGAPITITLEFLCCEAPPSELCKIVTVTFTINTGDTPATMASNLAAAMDTAFDDASCNAEIKSTGGRQVQVYGIPTQANAGCTADDPCTFPPDAQENQTEPYVEMSGYTYS